MIIKILTIIGAWLLILGVSSCHEQSDTLMTYDHADNLVFGEAEKSYAGEFKVLWNALNQNYSLWDYEKENGLDWDAVYKEYLSQFEALDEQDTVTDDELKELVKKVVTPLHDGHMVVMLKNHKTDKYVLVSPSLERNMDRNDFQIASNNRPNLTYYVKTENGEVELDASGNPIYQEYSTKIDSLLDKFKNTPGQGQQWIDDNIKALKNLPTPTAKEEELLRALTTLRNELNTIDSSSEGLQKYNALVANYSYLSIPGFNPISTFFEKNGIKAAFALLKGNIAYLYFSNFSLTPYVNEEFRNKLCADADEYTIAHVTNVKNVWDSWFESIQRLHNSGQLGGVIIDVRGNGGGMMSDYPYAMGALLPSGGFEYGKVRFKRGTGRLDFSPLIPQVIDTMEDEHAIITEPIVVLSNCRSVSMAEITSLSTKYIDNAYLIGKRTWGGLCSLIGNEYYTYNYSGHIGIENQTPVYVYLPSLATFTRDGKQLEGVGITPDIEVDLDTNQFKSTGKDTQLDRALQFIRTGN